MISSIAKVITIGDEQLIVLPKDIRITTNQIAITVNGTTAELEQAFHTYPKPANAGARWSPEEDEVLISAFESGKSLSELADIHQRTEVAIESRLVRLGLMDWEDEES